MRARGPDGFRPGPLQRGVTAGAHEHRPHGLQQQAARLPFVATAAKAPDVTPEMQATVSHIWDGHFAP